MKIHYDLNENADDDFVICEQCGTFFSDTAELDTEAKTVEITISGCYGDTTETLNLDEFVEVYSDGWIWPHEPFNTLLNDVMEKM